MPNSCSRRKSYAMLSESSPILYDSTTSTNQPNYASSSSSSETSITREFNNSVEDNSSTFPKLSKFHKELPDITLRGVILGLLIGTVLNFTNLYFGLQTGWISMMSLQASLIAFSLGKSLVLNNQSKISRDSELGEDRKKEYKWFDWSTPFGIKENVFIQTTAVATATMPLAGGFVGIIPALNLLTPEETSEYGGSQGLQLSTFKLIIWGLGIAFFGVFFAIPLRNQVIIKEKLKFPSGTATAQMIKVLHKDGNEDDRGQLEQANNSGQNKNLIEETKIHWNTLLTTFGISSGFTILSNIFTSLNVIPIFDIIIPQASQWGWYLSPTLSYVGQGIIMGVPTTLSMLLGAFIGWGILGPIAKFNEWAPGPINDWKTGAKGWILWISLGVMISESLVNLGILTFKEVKNFINNNSKYFYKSVDKGGDDDDDDNNSSEAPIIPNWLLITGLGLSFILCIISIKYLFHNIPLSSIFLSILLGCLLSILAVRSLGETDLNPVSGIGKVSQIIFGGILPGNIVANLVAGGIAEAGAQQAGDMMQDLQTGHLLHSSPTAQFIGQLIGSFVSVFISVFAYQLYNSVYTIPGKEFPVPTAQVWLDMARLVNGESLPPNSLPFTIIFSLIFTILPLLQELFPQYTILHYLPNGIAFAVGIYNPPNFTIPRVLGAIISDFYLKGWFTKIWLKIQSKLFGKNDFSCEFRENEDNIEYGNEMTCMNPNHNHTEKIIKRSPSFYRVWCTVIASGLVLGEGTMALVVLIVKAII